MVNIKPWSEAVDGEYTIRTRVHNFLKNKTAECQQIEFWQCQLFFWFPRSRRTDFMTCKKLIKKG